MVLAGNSHGSDFGRAGPPLFSKQMESLYQGAQQFVCRPTAANWWCHRDYWRIVATLGNNLIRFAMVRDNW